MNRILLCVHSPQAFNFICQPCCCKSTAGLSFTHKNISASRLRLPVFYPFLCPGQGEEDTHVQSIEVAAKVFEEHPELTIILALVILSLGISDGKRLVVLHNRQKGIEH